MDTSGRFDEEPIGWKIVSIGYDGSVLCESPQGHRRRYVFDGPAPEVIDPKAIVITAKASTDAHSCGTRLHWRSWKNVPVYVEAGIGTCHHPDGDKAAAFKGAVDMNAKGLPPMSTRRVPTIPKNIAREYIMCLHCRSVFWVSWKASCFQTNVKFCPFCGEDFTKEEVNEQPSE